MGSFFRKQGVVRMIVIVVALLLVVGLVGGVLAATKTSSGTTSAKTMTASSGSSSNSSSTPTVTRYTLTYSFGAYSEDGNVPSPVTVNAGTEITLDFDTYPCRSGYYFAGWDNHDGAGHPNYNVSDGWTTIVLNSDVTLYPVWYIDDSGNGGNEGGESSVTYGTMNVSVDGNVNFSAYHDPKGYDRTDDCAVYGSGSDSFSFGDDDYYLYVDTASDVTVTFTGYYEGTYYVNVSITLQSGEDNCANFVYFLCDPYKGYSYWTFSSGDSGTLSIVRSGGGH